MCYLPTEDQYVCEINQGIAEAVTGVLGGAQFSSVPFYHPRSSRGRFGHPREAAVCAGNFPDSNGISDDFKRQKRSHHTEPVPTVFKTEEIEQLVAPIALYPDSLVSQILMASTYPLEVVEAARWLRANKTLKGDALTTALEKQTWDPSVKSLVNFPQVLDMMNEKLDLTQRLGDAFLAQQKDVLEAIQRLRAMAQAQGNLKTTKEQTVIVERPPAQTTVVEQPAAQTTVVEQPAAQTTIIKIEPANPQVVYV